MEKINWQHASECLKVLSHPDRLKVVRILLDGEKSVGELAEACQLAPNVMSEHLNLMKRQGFLSSRRDERKVFYFVQEPALRSIMNCIENRFKEAQI